MLTQPFVQAQIKETPKLRVNGLCEGNSPVTGEFPAQMASNAENVSIWWRHYMMHAIFWQYWEHSAKYEATVTVGPDSHFRPV